jgi:hypothetical protein
MDCLVGSWFVGCSVGWLLGWLVGCLVDGSFGGELVGWFLVGSFKYCCY